MAAMKVMKKPVAMKAMLAMKKKPAAMKVMKKKLAAMKAVMKKKPAAMKVMKPAAMKAVSPSLAPRHISSAEYLVPSPDSPITPPGLIIPFIPPLPFFPPATAEKSTQTTHLRRPDHQCHTWAGHTRLCDLPKEYHLCLWLTIMQIL